MNRDQRKQQRSRRAVHIPVHGPWHHRERREINHPWQRYRWQTVGVIPGAGEVDEPRLLRQEAGWAQYHVATLPAALHLTETEGYKRNLANELPVVYVVMGSFDGDSESDIPRPSGATISPGRRKPSEICSETAPTPSSPAPRCPCNASPTSRP